MQNYERLYHYIHEYQQLIYDFYSKHVVAFLVTYWNINKETTIWEDEFVDGGAYERIAADPNRPLTGLRWNKILLLPVYYLEEVTTAFSGEEIGYIKEGETNIIIPSTYGITPYASDMVKFEQAYLRPSNDIYPIFAVTGVEKSTNTDRTFWKLKLMVEQSRTTTELDAQTSETKVFFDYNKKIHSTQEATSLTRMLCKNESLRERLRRLYNYNSGFYFI